MATLIWRWAVFIGIASIKIRCGTSPFKTKFGGNEHAKNGNSRRLLDQPTPSPTFGIIAFVSSDSSGKAKKRPNAKMAKATGQRSYQFTEYPPAERSNPLRRSARTVYPQTPPELRKRPLMQTVGGQLAASQQFPSGQSVLPIPHSFPPPEYETVVKPQYRSHHYYSAPTGSASIPLNPNRNSPPLIQSYRRPPPPPRQSQIIRQPAIYEEQYWVIDTESVPGNGRMVNKVRNAQLVRRKQMPAQLLADTRTGKYVVLRDAMGRPRRPAQPANYYAQPRSNFGVHYPYPTSNPPPPQNQYRPIYHSSGHSMMPYSSQSSISYQPSYPPPPTFQPPPDSRYNQLPSMNPYHQSSGEPTSGFHQYPTASYTDNPYNSRSPLDYRQTPPAPILPPQSSSLYSISNAPRYSIRGPPVPASSMRPPFGNIPSYRSNLNVFEGPPGNNFPPLRRQYSSSAAGYPSSTMGMIGQFGKKKKKL